MAASSICRVSLCFFAVLFLAHPAYSYWIFSHGALGLDARLDPIVSPGQVSGHSHTFVGSNAVTSSQTNVSIQSSQACTTAQAQADKSSYWTPTLYQYYQGSFEALPLSVVNTYYLQRGNMPLQAFPPGLRMVAGSAGARGPQNTTQLQNVVSFVCLNYDGGSSQTQTMPINGTCPQGLRAQLIFPSCWDGVNLDASDHKSHMSYPLGDFPDNGDACPSTHPIRFITLFYEFVWSTSYLNISSLVFANGDAIGYAFHGDFMNGWNTTVLQDAIDDCTGQLGGNVEACPPFTPTLNRTVASNCKVDLSQVSGRSSEQVDGKISNLPGCNVIFNGPLAGIGACGTNSTVSNTTNSSSSMPAGYQGCYAEPSSDLRALPYQAGGGSSNTVESCIAACSNLGYPVAGMEYSSQCFCGSQFSQGTLQMLDNDCSMTCSGNSSEFCGASKRLSVYSNLTAIPIATGPPTAPPTIAKNFQSLGCYADSTSNRTFPKRTSGNSLETCATSCNDYQYFGMEYADECYCGNTLTALQITDSSCNMVCSSNSTELCGGPNALNVYQNSALSNDTSTIPSSSTVSSSTSLTASSSTFAPSLNASSSTLSTNPTFSSKPSTQNTAAISSSTLSSPTASTSPLLLSGTQSIGCYIDAIPRSMSFTAYSNKSNTPSNCASTCRSKGYKYSGTEYSSECYCTNYLLNSAATGAGNNGCTMPCSGDSSQICGGSSRLSVVQDDKYVQTLFTVKQTGQWSFTDCIVDSTSKRSLSKSLSVSGNTPEKCLAACKAAGLTYCGLEYSGQCYGSKIAPTAASAPSIGNSDPIARGCSMPCAGNSSVVCGGSSRMNLYTYLGKNAPSISPSALIKSKK